jgi:hypothetical protein
MFGLSEKEKIYKEKVEKYKNKCNFITRHGYCYLQQCVGLGSSGYQPCDFERCIFMKLLNKK